MADNKVSGTSPKKTSAELTIEAVRAHRAARSISASEKKEPEVKAKSSEIPSYEEALKAHRRFMSGGKAAPVIEVPATSEAGSSKADPVVSQQPSQKSPEDIIMMSSPLPGVEQGPPLSLDEVTERMWDMLDAGRNIQSVLSDENNQKLSLGITAPFVNLKSEEPVSEEAESPSEESAVDAEDAKDNSVNVKALLDGKTPYEVLGISAGASQVKADDALLDKFKNVELPVDEDDKLRFDNHLLALLVARGLVSDRNLMRDVVTASVEADPNQKKADLLNPEKQARAKANLDAYYDSLTAQDTGALIMKGADNLYRATLGMTLGEQGENFGHFNDARDDLQDRLEKEEPTRGMKEITAMHAALHKPKQPEPEPEAVPDQTPLKAADLPQAEEPKEAAKTPQNDKDYLLGGWNWKKTAYWGVIGIGIAMAAGISIPMLLVAGGVGIAVNAIGNKQMRSGAKGLIGEMGQYTKELFSFLKKPVWKKEEPAPQPEHKPDVVHAASPKVNAAPGIEHDISGMDMPPRIARGNEDVNSSPAAVAMGKTMDTDQDQKAAVAISPVAQLFNDVKSVPTAEKKADGELLLTQEHAVPAEKNMPKADSLWVNDGLGMRLNLPVTYEKDVRNEEYKSVTTNVGFDFSGLKPRR